MLPDKLKSWDYYYDKLPLYFKNDDRIEEHFHAIFDLLVTLDTVEDELLRFFDVMADDYLAFINSFDDSVEKDKSDILEKIAKIYNVDRDFSVEVDGQTKQLHLNNQELLTLIKARIIQMSYDGSYKMAKDFYESVDLPVVMYFNAAASVDVLLNADPHVGLSDNFIDMFKAGLFVIESMGISYDVRVVEDIDNLAVFDFGDHHVWDVGYWL